MPTCTRTGHVYFIQAGKAGSIKIGFAIDPYARALMLQCASPYRLRILATIESSTSAEEVRLHRRFADDWLRGEWFKPVPRLLEFIRESAKKWDGRQVSSRSAKGRPPLRDPATTPLNLKVTLAFRRAAETYGAKHGIDGLGPAVKAAAERVYRAEGLL